MNEFHDTIATATSRFLETSMLGGALILLVLLIRLLLGRWLTPGLHLALWALAGLRFALPISLPSGLSLCNLFTSATTEPRALFASESASFPFSHPGISSHGGPDGWAPSFPTLFPELLFVVWLIGVMAILWVALRRQIQAARWVATLAPCRDGLLLEWLGQARVQTGVTRRLSVVENSRMDMVAVFGRFQATHLLIPCGFSSAYSEMEALGILRHELEHVRRGDLLRNWIALVIQTLHWFNPLVWLAGVFDKADQELACDRAALRRSGPAERRDYGTALLRLLELRCSRAIPASVVPFNSRFANLKLRLTMIRKPQSIHRWAQILGISLAGLAALATFTTATADQPNATHPESATAGKAGDSPEATAVRPAGPRDGEGVKPAGPRDGEGAKPAGPRDGEGPAKAGPKDDPTAPKAERGDADAPGAPAAAQALLKSKEGGVFLAYDKDGNGQVTAEEIAAMRSRELSRRDLRKLQEVIKELDFDGKPDTLSLAEFVRWRKNGSPMGKSGG